jgi:hypothetical protein
MFSWFRKFSRHRPSRDELLNEGLDLAMNWEEDWLAPINRRLGERHPQVSKGELEELNVTCRHALTFALETAHTMLHGGPERPIQEAFDLAIKARYPWVTQENLARMLNQGLYYAAKIGGHGRVA